MSFVEKVKALSIGDPKTEVNIGAVVSKAHQEKVLSYIELAKQKVEQFFAVEQPISPR
jgi:aminomuconate-semialdehyde/2-hydroxymuconate-6-semialdehyde dehydrogenase